MEAGFELEDDVFFADMSKQISLLIMDDDDDDSDSLSRCPAVNLQAFTADQAIHPGRSQAFPFLSYDQQHQTNKREISKGTGVFIPLSSHPRRKNVKQGRFSTTGSNNKPSDHNSNYSSRGISQSMAYNNNNNSNIRR